MSDEKKIQVVGERAAVPSVISKLRTPVVLTAVGVGVAIGALVHLYWLAGIVGVVGVIVLLRIAQSKTAEHESKLSLPPALDAMKKRLGSLALDPALNRLAERAQNQLLRLESGMKKAAETLPVKLDPGELAYARFQTGFENAAGAVFAELQDTVEHLNRAALIGAKESAAEPSKAQAQQCLEANEKALQAFAAAVAAVGTMETNSNRVELPQAIHDLEQIAARARKLSLNQGENNG